VAYTDREDLNYLGMLYLVGAYQTPFLNAIGGINSGKTTNSFLFPVAQPWTLTAASQPAITEAASATSVTLDTKTRGNDTNTVQIFQRGYGVSYAKQSTFGEIGAIANHYGSNPGNPVKDELAFQKMAALKQIAIDMDYTFLQGSYQAAADATTAGKTRGLANAISTNTVAAGGVKLTKDMINALLKEMADNGAQWGDMMLVCNSFNKQVITSLYEYAPEDRNIGGTNIQQIETDFCKMGVMYDTHMPTSAIYIVDMSVCSPMFCPINGQIMIVESLAKTAAFESGQIYMQVGLDYGPEEFHGSITGTAIA